MDNYAIELLHITKVFPGIVANDDITLRVRYGEIHALLGENGAGKSTLMSVLFGLYQPEEGEILVNGKKAEIKNPRTANALGIGMVHQHFMLVQNFTVLENIVLGVETGITLEFQFGTNWSRYSEYVGDIFGSLLAIEATAAFFLESTFLAVWAFGWERVSKKVHLTAIWLVAIASTLSAQWIILANGWMQNPDGYVIKNGRAELSSFFDVVTNPFAWSQYFHTIFAAWMLGGFFVLGVSSWHLLR